MDNQKISGNLMGYYHFTSKDKANTYYVVQLLRTDEEGLNNKKSFLKDIFTDELSYKSVIQNMVIGDKLEAQIKINMNNDKVYYKVVV